MSIIMEDDLLVNYIEMQKRLCEKYNSELNFLNKKLFIGCSNDLLSDPINGFRHPKEGVLSGWYIWSGEWSNDSDFFKPLCVTHLLKEVPQVGKFLGLDVGFRFLIGKNNYEDVWYDEKLKHI